MSKQMLAALGLIIVMGMSGCAAPEALEALALEALALEPLATEGMAQTVDAAEPDAATAPASNGVDTTELTPAQLTALARITDYGPAPELVNDVWINSEPLRLADLRGNVVIVEFWTYG
jgi:hypothetical protein